MKSRSTKKTTEHQLWRKLALQPCLGQLTQGESETLMKRVEELEVPEYFTFLQDNRLGPLWREYLSTITLPDTFSPWLDRLREDDYQLAARQLKERKHLSSLHLLFEKENIPYFIFKGANLRYTIYRNQTLRSSCDIDIFVPEVCKLDAAKLLTNEGFELKTKKENISHEVSLVKEGVCIDLHWHLIRPGRSPAESTDFLFANRKKFADGVWGLNEKASLFVMLVHPAITKHLASRDSMLIHLVDLARLLESDSSQWGEVKEFLGQTRLKTAAWSSLYVLYLCSGSPKHLELVRQVEPPFSKRRYLRYWIDNDLLYRFFNKRLFVRGFFSLALQDTFNDMASAVMALKIAKKLASQQVKEFEQLIQ